jgi:hypothetical protein
VPRGGDLGDLLHAVGLPADALAADGLKAWENALAGPQAGVTSQIDVSDKKTCKNPVSGSLRIALYPPSSENSTGDESRWAQVAIIRDSG